MAMHGDDGDDLIVATGGFTREVLCWQVLGSKSGEPLQRLRGHTGVVHCVRWRADGRALVSGSEDRSVRVWLAAEGSGGAGIGGCAMPALVHADSLWGHAARIWDCQISDDLIATVSEDSSGRVYRYSQQELRERLQGAADASSSARHPSRDQASSVGQCVSVLKGHQGKHVWKCVICPLATGGVVVSTGGNDASTKIWSTGAYSNGVGDSGATSVQGGSSARETSGGEVEMPVTMDSYEVPLYSDDDSERVMSACDMVDTGTEGAGGRQEVGRAGGKKGPREEFVRCCALLKQGCQVLCGTNQGRAVLLERATGAWSCLYKNSACQFTTVGVDEELAMAVLGDARGGLSVVSLASGAAFAAYTMAAHSGHVMDVFFRRDACTHAPLLYSGDNAETPSGSRPQIPRLARCRRVQRLRLT